ncbi:MAG: Rrf2 family transcriptional regulator [Candidatus Marinimicrobia bacterium]|nr:Rrf2 family transcriptional regulator [Candidatus Neomarinimicrobiota bacterium]MCF7840525.1 Rrf2 family transcriptional regulator [Candidatus Neomarinimicrobiota bacterium]
MKFSTQEEYGLRCLLQIGHNDRPEGLTIPEIAKREGLSVHNVGKLLRILRMNGLIQSVRGKTGGYTLAKSADEIIIGDVLEVLGGRLFDGQFCETHSGSADVCVHHTHCTVRSLWCSIQNVLDRVLQTTTLRDLLDQNQMSWWVDSLQTSLVHIKRPTEKSELAQ